MKILSIFKSYLSLTTSMFHKRSMMLSVSFAEIEKLKEEVNQTIEKNVELNQKFLKTQDKKLSMMFHLILLLQN